MNINLLIEEEKYQSQPCEYMKSSTSMNMLTTEEQIFSQTTSNISISDVEVTSISSSTASTTTSTSTTASTKSITINNTTTVTSKNNNATIKFISSDESQTSYSQQNIQDEITLSQLTTQSLREENEEISTASPTTTSTTTTKKISCKIKSPNKKLAVGEYHQTNCVNGTKLFKCTIDGTLSLVSSTCLGASKSDWLANMLNIKVSWN
jgi:hypothetical protein